MTSRCCRSRGVLFIASHVLKYGGDRVLINLATGLDQQLFRPVLCCVKRPGPGAEEVKDCGISVYSSVVSTKFDPTVVLRLLRIIKQNRIDVIYGIDHLYPMVLGTLVADMAGIPAVFSIHHTGYDTKQEETKLKIFLRMCQSKISKIVALSALHRNHIIKRFKLRLDKVIVINNGIKLEKFLQDKTNSNALKRSLGLPNNSVVLGAVARLAPEKRIDVMLKAFSKVKGSDERPVFLMIAGDGPLREQMGAFSQELGVAERVRFLGFREDVADLLHIFDIFLLSSAVETFSIATIEAMAAGIPAIVTDIGGMPDLVTDGETGFVVPRESSDSLANAIQKFIDNDFLRIQMGEAAQRRAVERFSCEKMVSAHERLFEELIEAKNRRTYRRW